MAMVLTCIYVAASAGKPPWRERIRGTQRMLGQGQRWNEAGGESSRGPCQPQLPGRGQRPGHHPMCTLSQHGYGVRIEGVPEPTPEQHEAKAALQVCSWPAKTGEVCYTQPWPACPFSA